MSETTGLRPQIEERGSTHVYRQIKMLSEEELVKRESLFVEAGCGGGLTRSNTVTVGIADKPSCSAYCADSLTAQPASFEVLTDDAAARLLARVPASSASSETASRSGAWSRRSSGSEAARTSKAFSG